MTRQGFTLLEVLICGGLFLLALGLCGQLAMLGINTRRQVQDRNGAFRQSVTLFHLLQRDLQETRRVYLPDVIDLAAHQPGLDSPALVLQLVGNGSGPLVVGWNLAEERLTRTIYQNDFDPVVPGSHQPLPGEAVKKSAVERFLVQMEPPGQRLGHRMLRVEVSCSKQMLSATHVLGI